MKYTVTWLPIAEDELTNTGFKHPIARRSLMRRIEWKGL
jgi:hypothetical protein